LYWKLPFPLRFVLLYAVLIICVSVLLDVFGINNNTSPVGYGAALVGTVSIAMGVSSVADNRHKRALDPVAGQELRGRGRVVK
jgi:uncharacterized membrane protein